MRITRGHLVVDGKRCTRAKEAPALEQLDNLRAVVQRFEVAAGLEPGTITGARRFDADRAGQYYRAARTLALQHNPTDLAERLTEAATALRALPKVST